MLTATTDYLEKLQPQPAGGVQLDTAAKADVRENQQDPANRTAQRSLSAASLEQYVRDHLAEMKNLPLSQLPGNSADSWAREKLEEQKQADDNSPYSMNSAMAQQQAADEQAAQDEAEKEYDEHVLTAQELVEFDQSVTQYRNDSQNTQKDLDQLQTQLDQQQKDIQSREIVVNGHHYAIDDKTGKYYDVEGGKDVDPNKDPALAAQLDALSKSQPIAKKSKIDEHNAKQKDHDDLQNRKTADDDAVNTAANKKTKTGADQNGVDGNHTDVNEIDQKVKLELQQNAANVKADQQAQIKAQTPQTPRNTPKPPVPENQVADTEKKNRAAYTAANKETLDNKEDRLSKLSSLQSANTADSIHSMLALSQTNQKANLQAGNTPAPPNRPASFASSQSGLTNDADDKLKKLGGQVQSAFNSGAQGANPPANLSANNPSPANNNPASTPPANKKPAAPAMA